MGQVNRMLTPPEPLRRVMHDARGRDRHLGGKQRLPRLSGWRGTRARRASAGPHQKKIVTTAKSDSSAREDRDGARDPTKSFMVRRSRQGGVLRSLRNGAGCQLYFGRVTPFGLILAVSRLQLRSRRRSAPPSAGFARPRSPDELSYRKSDHSTYRPRGSADVRALIDGGFQAFNAGRLSEACHIFADKMLAPENDTTIGLTVAGAMTPAGLGGCVIELMERGLSTSSISTGANLYHDLHYALNFTLHRGSPFLDDVELYEQGIIRIYDILFPATVLLETDAYIRDFLVAPRSRARCPTSEFHYRLGRDLLERQPRVRGILGRRRAAQCWRAGLHLVARRQLDRHEHRVSRADEWRDVDDRSQPRRQRSLRDHPRRQAKRLRDPRRRLAEELLPAGPADAVGGLRHPEGRQRLLHSDHDRSGGLGRSLRRDAGRSRQLGQGQSRRAARHRRRLLRFDDRLSALLRIRGRLEHNRRTRKELLHKREELVADLLRQAKETRGEVSRRIAKEPAEIDRHR